MNKEEIALALGKLLTDLSLRDVMVLDLIGISSWCDYMIIATTTSNTLAGTAIRESAFFLQESDVPVKNIKPDRSNASGWLLLDASDYIIHVLTEEKREFYAIEGFWKDAKVIYKA